MKNAKEERIPSLRKRKDQNQAWTAGPAQDGPTQSVTPPEIYHHPPLPLSLHPRDTKERQKYETLINPTARCLFSPGHFPVYVTREGWKGLKDHLVRWLEAAASAITREAPSRYGPGPLPRNSELVVWEARHQCLYTPCCRPCAARVERARLRD